MRRRKDLSIDADRSFMVHHIRLMIPAEWISSRVLLSPAFRDSQALPFAPLLVFPPAPFTPFRFSKLLTRECCPLGRVKSSWASRVAGARERKKAVNSNVLMIFY